MLGSLCDIKAILQAGEQERRNAKPALDDDNSSVMIHVDVHRAYFSAQVGPNTYVEVPDEDQTEEGKVCGCLVKVMYGSRQAASAWQEERKKAIREVNMHRGASSLIELTWMDRILFTVTTSSL